MAAEFFQLSQRAAVDSYARWTQEYTKEFGKPPRNRQSFIALKRGTKPSGYVFNYENLELLEKRHRHGWKVRRNHGLTHFPHISDVISANFPAAVSRGRRAAERPTIQALAAAEA